MTTTWKLEEIDEVDFPFEGDTFVAAYHKDLNRMAVPIFSIAKTIGLENPSDQESILKEDEVARDFVYQVRLHMPYGTKGAKRLQEVACLDIDYIASWMGMLNSKKVTNPQAHAKLIVYKRDLNRVVNKFFRNRWIDQGFTAEIDSRRPQDQVDKILDAIGPTINDILLEVEHTQGYVEFTNERIDEILKQFGSLGRQFASLLMRLQALIPIDAHQQYQIHRIVVAIGSNRRKLNPQDENTSYGRTWDDFHRKFKVSKYEELPQENYPEAIRWLRNLWDRYSREEPPAGLFEDDGTQSDLFAQ